MVAAAVLSVSPVRTQAANVFWDVNGTTWGTGGTGNWDTSSNFWVNAGAGTTVAGTAAAAAYTFTSADTAYFTGAKGAVALQQGITVGGLYFGNPGFSISGNTLTLAAGSTINAAGDATISSVVAGSTFTKAGAGILTLSAANTLTGVVTLTAGSLRAITDASSLGQGSLTLNGGTLILANDTGLNYARNATVAANSAIIADRLTVGAGVTHTLGTLSLGAFTLNSSLGGQQTTGSGGVTFGALTLTGAGTINTQNSFSTPAVTNTTTLASVGGATFGLTIGGSGVTTINGAITTTTGGLTKTGNGTLNLNGANTNTGALTINGGSVVVGAGGTLASTQVVTFGAANTGGGLFNFNSASTASATLTQSLGALSFLGGDGTVQSTLTAGPTSSTLTFGSLAVRTLGATGNFVLSGGVNGTSNSIKLTGQTAV